MAGSVACTRHGCKKTISLESVWSREVCIRDKATYKIDNVILAGELIFH
jgi:hypothetical protein